MPMLKLRTLRRRWVFLVIVWVVVTLILTKTYSKSQDLVADEYEIKRTLLRQPFQWQPKVPDVSELNATRQWICRNSVQGQHLIVDERGYVCGRGQVDTGGCCDTKHHLTTKHSCDTCEPNGCCATYEYCVSCCLAPDKISLMKKILREGREALDKLFASVENLFDLCLAKCRTSSLVSDTMSGARKPRHLAGQADNKDVTDYTPFTVKWLNSCYQQTLLPDAPWHVMEDKMCKNLADRVTKQFARPERKEALIAVLGESYTKKYIPRTSRQPYLLEPPNMQLEEKNKLIKEAQAYLNSQLYKAVKELNYHMMLTGNTGGDQPTGEYADFLSTCFNVFNRGLDRELYKQEAELARRKAEDIIAENRLKRMVKIPAPSRVKPATGTGTPSTLSSASSKPPSAVIRTMVHKVEGDPPPLWGPQSDAIGTAIMAILEREPRKFDSIAGKMHGRQLPGTLRAHMWADVLFREERKRLKDVNIEKLLRERFAKAVGRGVQELGVPRATVSPIAGLIENAIIETYNKTTSMVAYKTGDHMKETIRALNVLYVYDRSYEPYLIHWLFPLQVAFQKPLEKSVDKGEHVYELAMFLDLLNYSCFPTWPQVFAIAEQVMSTLSQQDPDMFTHLKNIATTDIKINKKEFLIQLISIEKAKAEELLKATPGSIREITMSTELLADPLVFLRRWIGEGFVSVLDTPGVMYVWDQCFLQKWQHTVLKHFCLALLQLLRYKFMRARDYTTMKQVFLYEPCKLFTVDIQQAWISLEQGKDLLEIPYMNRQRPVTPSSRLSREVTDRSPTYPGMLHIFGIKDVILKMIIPSESVEREPWLEFVDPAFLSLGVNIYFGGIKLRSRNSTGKAFATTIETDTYSNKIYDCFFDEDKFVFENVDVSAFDVEQELGASPYALIIVSYEKQLPAHKGGNVVVPFGWARLPLFQRIGQEGRTSVDSSGPQWKLLEGDVKVTLHPGDVPDSLVTAQPLTPTGESKEAHILGYSSFLGAIVYDGKYEPRGRPKERPVAPPTPPELSPEPEEEDKQRTPTPLTPPASPSPWVQFKPLAARNDSEPSSLKEAFDLYIDAVRFIPDTASIIKITGVVNTMSSAESKILLALPELTSPARSPEFEFRLTYNEAGAAMDPNMIAFLRVYTLDITTEEIVVIGSCFLRIFTKDGLNVGGHQLRLKSGLPPSVRGGKYKITDLDKNTKIPAMTLLVRLLPHTNKMIPPKKYGVGYYHSDLATPTVSEQRIFASYSEHMNYPSNVKAMIHRLQASMETPLGETDEELLGWLQGKLDIKKAGIKAAGNLPLDICVRYRIKTGLRVKINQLYGLPAVENLYIQCMASIEPGDKVLSMTPTPEGHGGEEKFVTLKPDYNSLICAPEWLDEPRNLHPWYDPLSVMVVQLIGLSVKYKSRNDHAKPGLVLTPDDTELVIGDEQMLGWTVIPLFESNAVLMGVHDVPIFRGRPPEGIVEAFSLHNVQDVIERWKWDKKSQKIPGMSMRITLWDGHYDYKDIPAKPIFDNLLTAAGSKESYITARENPRDNKKLNTIVMNGLQSRYQRQGFTGEVYKKEEKFFTEAMSKTFYTLMEDLMINDGKAPLRQTPFSALPPQTPGTQYEV